MRDKPAGLPPLRLDTGVVEALKWLGLVLMTGDHVNKYLLRDSVPLLFDLGRLTMPLFGFVLAYNLARPGAFESGAYPRTMKRLLLAGAVASLPFIALGGLLAVWWPLNVMFTLLAAVACIYLWHGGAGAKIGAAAVFLVAGSSVEFWWPALAYCIAAWTYCTRPRLTALLAWIAACASLWVINRNGWALAAMPLIFLAGRIKLKLLRRRLIFYAYYPCHLVVIWMMRTYLN